MSDSVNVGPGEEWWVVICHNPACAKPLLLERIEPHMRDADGLPIRPKTGTLEATCPFCKLTSVYQAEEIRYLAGQVKH